MPRKQQTDTLDLFIPELIVAGDLHAGNLTPDCRDDDYMEALLDKLGQIAKLQRLYKCPVIFPGDLFDNWNQNAFLFNRLITVWPSAGPVLAVPGQHDLPQHNIQLQGKTAFQTMVLAGLVRDVSNRPFEVDGIFICGAPWGGELPDCPRGATAVLVWHVTTWEKPFAPGQRPSEATRLLKKHKYWDLIVTGDNHQTFECRDGDRLLLNAGSVMRIRSDQVDHRPCVFLWRRDGTYQKQYLTVDPQVVSRDAVEREKLKTERVNAFVEKLAGEGDVSLSFDDNVDELLKHEEDDAVVKLTLECCGR